MKTYISGPIAGYPNANREAFEDAARLVRLAGGTPLLPHDISPRHDGPCPKDPIRGADGHGWTCHLRADILEMMTCDAVVMMPGWERSHGAREEHRVACVTGMPVHYLIGGSSLARDSNGYPLQQRADDMRELA